nr:hypothetical protein [Halorubrum yunnanense]
MEVPKVVNASGLGLDSLWVLNVTNLPQVRVHCLVGDRIRVSLTQVEIAIVKLSFGEARVICREFSSDRFDDLTVKDDACAPEGSICYAEIEAFRKLPD